MNVVRLADVRPVPWRNGGGVTRELLAWPDASSWQLRISVAEVASDGPFSKFEGVERWFAVLEGEGVRLTIRPSFPRRQESKASNALDSRLHGNDGVHAVRRGSPPLRFDGGAEVSAELIAGPTIDFNLMARPGVATLRWEGKGVLVVESQPILARYEIGTGTSRWEQRL